MYTLSNDLFSVEFKKDNGKLMFNGSDNLFLLSGEELFSITLGNGTVVPASEMTLGGVRVVTLAPDLKATRASEKLSGQALEADFTYGDLTLLWKAVLRDGSHYLRTSLDLTAAEDVAMKSITPMIYTVDNVSAGSAPVVVGNTRGALLASDKIFAGLETPMGINTVPSTSDITNFVYDVWQPESWAWTPGEETPQGILDLDYSADKNIIGYRGAVAFKEAGEQTITLQYSTGNHKLTTVGVDIVKDGAVISSDYHHGTTGNSHSNNVYTINVPEKGAYLVRFFADQTEVINSKGTVTYSKPVKEANVVFGTDPNKGVREQVARKAPTARVLAAGTEISVGTSLTDTWAEGDWKALEEGAEASAVMAALGLERSQIRSINNAVNIQAPGMLSVGLQYTGGSRKVYTAGVDLLDAEGNLVAYDYFKDASDATNGVTYTILVPQAGSYTLRYLEDTSHEETNCTGNITINYAAITATDLAIGGTATDGWTSSEWQTVTAAPDGITALDFEVSQLRAFNSDYLNISSRGMLSAQYVYDKGNKRLYIAGLELLDANGEVVAADYHSGNTGGSHSNNVYSLKAPAAGYYKLRYWCETKSENAGLSDSQGHINIALSAIKTIDLSSSTTATDAWEPGNWKDMVDNQVPAAIVGSDVSTSSGTEPVSVANVKSIQQDIVVPANGGRLSATFTFGAGGNRLDIAGVDVVDDNNNVVASDYHNGYAGIPNNHNVYSLLIPTGGTYTLRYFYNQRENNTSSGSISLSLEKIKLITMMEDVPSADSWTPDSWREATEAEIPKRINEVGAEYPYVKVCEQYVVIPVEKGKLSLEFLYSGGNNRIDIVGVDILDANNDVIASDYHFGYTGYAKENNIYSMTVPYAGTFTLRYFCNNEKEGNTSSGNINLNYGVEYTLYLPPLATSPIQGVWSRNTTLQAGKTWNVSAVVGLIAPGQARRSFLAYSERERAVPWRPFPVYISWYELNINRNNSQDYSGNMTVEQCAEVVNQWKTNLYEKHNANVKSFVWDDGWDEYGTWTFNPNFPNGFQEPNEAAVAMKSNIGAWLGPVGGYGESGTYRRAYWNGKGGMQLSNPDYYNVFLTACTNMIEDYSFNFFKYDGISDDFSALGPDKDLNITVAEENAEAIINIEREIRKIKPDIFLNTTVGTWASPFWFQFTDAVWRQENDYDVIGDNSIKRENWITYRDRLVYQNFVQNSPLCPINTLMTHGFILTNYGPPANPHNDSYEAIRRELRCAFACGSGMVELYNDFSLTNSIEDGALWADIAECIRWQERNADVLPDIHWVGGNPWTGAKAEVYGWASWNGKKATLALRNGANDAQSYTFTLREALDIPAYVQTTVKFSQAFEVQDALSGLVLGKSYDVDEEITVTLPGSSVFVFDGIDEVGSETVENGFNLQVSSVGVSTLHLPYAATIPAGVTVKYLTAATADPTQVEEGIYTLKYTAIEGNILPANTPVVVMAEAGSYAFMETTETGTPVTGNLLVGSADGKKPSTAEQLYALGVREGVVAFYPYEGIGYNTNKAYLDITSLNLGTSAVKQLLFVDDDMLTGIDAVKEFGASEEKVYTDLSGRRVKNPARGIYIQGGKKVVITK